MKNQEDIKKLISAYIDGEVTEQEKDLCEEHLASSAEAQAYYKELSNLNRVLDLGPQEALSGDAEQEIRSRVLKAKREEKEMKSSTLKIGVTGGVFALLLVACLVTVQQTTKILNVDTPSPRPFTAMGQREKELKDENVSEPGRVDLRKPQQTAPLAHVPLKERKAGETGRFFGMPSLSMERSKVAYDMDAGGFRGEALLAPGDESWRYNDAFNTEGYSLIVENEFKTVNENPLSTFSVDVDTASYSNIRRFLNDGGLPPADAVRIEEMINYFDYEYPAPADNSPFSVTVDGGVCPWEQTHRIVRIGIQGKTLESTQIPPSNLVFLIDVSGSMQDENKLPLLKKAFAMLVNQLSAQEKVALVVYAGSAGLVLDSTHGDNKQAILSAVENLTAGGSTAGGEGINLAYQIAKKNFIAGGNNRVILATDGDFNVGVSGDGELVRVIEEKRKEGIALTVLGFGMGNYKDSKMEQLADKGNGNYYYIDTEREAKKVLVEELGSTLFTIAKDVKIQVEFNPAKVKAYRLVGYENRVLAKEDFNDDTKDAGEIGAGHTVTALYEIVPAGSAEVFPGVDDLKYQEQKIISADDLLTVKLRYKAPDGDTSQLLAQVIAADKVEGEIAGDLKFAASVAEFGMLLRNSKFKSASSYDHVLSAAGESKGEDGYGYRGEFIGLVEKAKSMDTREDAAQEGENLGMQFKGEAE